MNFADWRSFDAPVPVRRPHFEPVDTERSLKNLAATGANWVALVVRGGQETIQSTDIFYKPPATATDEDLRRAIDIAHALGFRVMLKPHVHLAHDPNHIHIEIGTAFTTEEQWQAWFASYRQFIIHYATLARDAGADMFLIGQELASTTHREDDWRRIAREVRQVYKGPIIYEAVNSLPPFWSPPPPFGEEQRITWWDAVDYIGVEGYYPLTQKNNPTVEELKSAWVGRGWLDLLENLSKKYQKPIVISEIGYLSKDGTNTDPANFQKFAQVPLDLQEQTDCYQAALEVLWGKPWLAGIYWWDWSVGPAATSSFDAEYVTPQGKPAEEVLKKFYLSQ